ncbi:HNH endonuclease [Novosphingobium sp. PhB165]|nr:HNH endonuclease [Novosphingobium sp. PhB165]
MAKPVSMAFKDMSCSKRCENCGNPFYRDKRNTRAYWQKAKFCSRECFGAFDARRKVDTRLPFEQDFLRWFSKGDGCWEWIGAIDRDGYGIFSYAGKTYRAHRIAMQLDGRDPGDMMACHHCDNPVCVRPDHLFAGTNADNMQDMVAKGRNPNRFGANNPNFKHGRTAREHCNG